MYLSSASLTSRQQPGPKKRTPENFSHSHLPAVNRVLGRTDTVVVPVLNPFAAQAPLTSSRNNRPDPRETASPVAGRIDSTRGSFFKGSIVIDEFLSSRQPSIRRLRREEAAIDGQDMAGHHAGGLGRQENGGTHDLFRLPSPAHRSTVHEIALRFWIGARSCHHWRLE